MRCEAITAKGTRCKNHTLVRYPYCWIHCRQILGLDVRPSHIPTANKGLFAYKDFRRGERINQYTGEILTQHEYDERYANTLAPYAVKVNNNTYIDATNPLESSLARYANDCRENDKRNGYCRRNNAKLSVNPRSQTISLKAIKPIHPQDEIYASYGRHYW